MAVGVRVVTADGRDWQSNAQQVLTHNVVLTAACGPWGRQQSSASSAQAASPIASICVWQTVDGAVVGVHEGDTVGSGVGPLVGSAVDGAIVGGEAVGESVGEIEGAVQAVGGTVGCAESTRACSPRAYPQCAQAQSSIDSRRGSTDKPH